MWTHMLLFLTHTQSSHRLCGFLVSCTFLRLRVTFDRGCLSIHSEVKTSADRTRYHRQHLINTERDQLSYTEVYCWKCELLVEIKRRAAVFKSSICFRPVMLASVQQLEQKICAAFFACLRRTGENAESHPGCINVVLRQMCKNLMWVKI